MRTTIFNNVATLAVVGALTACGGGGGGDGGGGPVVVPPVTPPATTAPATIVLHGFATYDLVTNPNGGLVYAGVAPKPVRSASVEIINAAATVIATTTTDASGAYSVSVPSLTDVRVRVRAQMLQSGSSGGWDVTVRDNTQSDAIYSMESPLFNSGASSVERNINAPSGWGGTSYTSARVAGPFAVLDTVYIAQSKVASVASSIVFPQLKVFWSVNNLPASGDRKLGQIGTTSFVTSGGARAIYVLGKENVDTDEYDASVIAHEWGHYYQSAFSRDDSPGGSHAISQRVDRRLAFSEGWGNAWSGIALERSNYTDSVGDAQAQGTNLDLTTGPTNNPGWFRESSIQSILWQLNKQAGFKPIHDTLTGDFKTAVAVTSIHPFAASYRALTPSNAAGLNGLLSGQSISTVANNPFGVNESNNGGLALTLPMYGAVTVGGGGATACVSDQFGDGNKHGSFSYLRFSAASARNYQITVAGPGTSDPDLVVYGGSERARSNGTGASETASVALTTGDYVLVVNDYNNSSVNTCFTVTIN